MQQHMSQSILTGIQGEQHWLFYGFQEEHCLHDSCNMSTILHVEY